MGRLLTWDEQAGASWLAAEAASDWAADPAVPRSAKRRAASMTGRVTSVTAPATQNDRIDVDIQLAGVKPTERAIVPQADTHQEM